ncbi:MAG: hypothetical protein M3R17_12600 [Bacteroidota bacterium]|nr:hypothetical protein [Bacteroidota bacterium]
MLQLKNPVKSAALVLFIFLFPCCKNDTARIAFLYDNVSNFKEKNDIRIFLNDSLVLNETLPTNNIADAWKSKIAEVKKGKYTIRVESKIKEVEMLFNVNLDTDTTYIVEYQHSYVLDSMNRGLTEGKKHFLIMPARF